MTRFDGIRKRLICKAFFAYPIDFIGTLEMMGCLSQLL